MPNNSRSNKPFARMRRLAELLGWRGLRLEQHVPPADSGLPEGMVITWYATSDEKFFLQINENPIGQIVTHQATVCAGRYGIRDVGWHKFELFDDTECLRREAKRLDPWIARKHFKEATSRRAFKSRHPELLIPSRKRRRR